MNVLWHAATAVPFVLAGDPWTALGCVVPDIAWLPNEWRYRRSSLRPWARWADATLAERHLRWYRVTHSMLLVAVVAALIPGGVRSLMLGMLVHQTLDLFTHRGVMRQRPLYPFPWRWPWSL